jgi:site-specific DNA recombinase
MKKAVGYIRVSTERQADEGVSLDAQKAKIAAWAVANDYELLDVYVDAGISGRRMKNRPGLQQALDATKKEMVLVVYSLSRMSRSVKDTLTISDSLDKRGADLVSLSEKLDTTGAAGKMLFRMLAVIAEFESDVNSERTKAAMSHKKAAGEKYASVPFGYSEIEGRLVIVEQEAAVVAEILNQRAGGETLQNIADYLNKKGISGKLGGKWHPSTVSYLINRQAA